MPFSQVDVLGLKSSKVTTPLNPEKPGRLPNGGLKSRHGSRSCSLVKAVTILTIMLNGQCSWTELGWMGRGEQGEGEQRGFWEGLAPLPPRQWSKEETDGAAEQTLARTETHTHATTQIHTHTHKTQPMWGDLNHP